MRFEEFPGCKIRTVPDLALCSSSPGCSSVSFFLLRIFLTFIFAYLFTYLAALGLSCSTQNLPSLLRHESSLVGASKLQTLSCGMWDLVP